MGLMKYFMEEEVVVDNVVADVPTGEESGVADAAPVLDGESEDAVAVVEEEVAPVADSVAVSGGAAPVLDVGVNITA